MMSDMRVVTYDLLVRSVLPLSPDPGPVYDRAHCDILWCYAVLRFPRPRHRAGFRLWSYAVIWPMIYCDDVCVRGYGDLKLLVLCCVVAPDRVATTFCPPGPTLGPHMICDDV